MTDAPTGRSGSLRPPVPLLVAFSILGPISIHMILPSLPHLAKSFDADFATVQLLVSLFALAFGGGQVLVGPLADLVGRRRVLVWGMAVFAAASLACALAPGVEALIVFRVVQGLSACSGTVLARALIRDHWQAPASTRVLGYLAMGIALGPIFAPTLGGLLFQSLGWRAPFAVMAVLGAGNAVLAARFLPEVAGRGGALGRLGADLGRLVRDRGFLTSWFSVCFNAGTAFTFIACAPLVAEAHLGMTPLQFGLWSGTGALGYIVGNFGAGRLSRVWPGERVLAIGAIGVAMTAASLCAELGLDVTSPAVIFGTFAVLMAFSGLVMPNSYAGAMEAVPSAAGSASGFVGFAQFAMGAVFASGASTLIERTGNPVWLGLVMLAASLAGLGVAVLLLWRERGAFFRNGE